MRLCTTPESQQKKLPVFRQATITALIGVLLSITASAQPPAQPAHDLGRLLDQLRDEWKAPGAILAIQFPDGEIKTFTSGVRNLETEHPMQADDGSYIGSITKMFTAVAALQLVDEGKISLDDRLAKFRPDFPRAEQITVRQLLNHSSGIDDPYVHLYMKPMEEMLQALEHQWTPEEMIAWAARLDPQFEPGAGYFYSSVNFDLVGRIIESVTGGELHTEVRTRICDRVGLDATWFAGRDTPRRPVEIVGYIGQTDFWPNSSMFGELGPCSDLDDPVQDWASGAIMSNTRDMLLFFEALRSGKLLSDESLDSMMTFINKADGSVLAEQYSRSGYGLGLMSTVRPEFRMIGHGGMYNGYTAQLWYVPATDITVALLVNRGFVFESVLIVEQITKQLDPA